MVILLLLLAFISALVVYMFWPTWKVRHVPTLPYIWGIGHIPLVKKHQAQVFIKFLKEVGPIYRLQLGRQPIVFVATPELCQEIGVKKFKSAPNRVTLPYMKESPIHLHGLFQTRGSRWTKMRSILLPMFHYQNLSNYVPLMEQVMADVMEILEQKADAQEDVNMTMLVQKMALDIIGETALGAEFGLVKEAKARTEDSDLIDAVLKSLNALLMDDAAPLSTLVGMLFPVLQHPVKEIFQRIPGTGDWQQHTGNLRLEEQIRALLVRRKAQRDKVTRKDVFSLLLDEKDKSKEMEEFLSDEYVAGLSYELMLAGSESTAISLCFILYYISKHPEVEAKLLTEIDRLAPRGSVVGLEEVDKFTYVQQVIKEGMRIITFSPVVARELEEDVELGGYHLPKGTWVWMSINAMAQNAEEFPEPHLFKPERFDPECEENKRRHRCSHSPFGIGPRQCVGYKFANLEMGLSLIHFYQRFTFRHSPLMEKPLATRMGIVVRPTHGVQLRVHKRL